MSLRKKVLLIIGITVCILMAVLYGLSRIIILKSFIALEESDAHQHVERVVTALSNHLTVLHGLIQDWSVSDTTCKFVEGKDPDYIANNLMDETFLNLQVNLMVFLDKTGRIVFAKAFDVDTQQEMSVPAALSDHLTPGKPLVGHRSITDSLTGFLILPHAPMFVISHPIVDSHNQGPIRGTLIMGRYLDESAVAHVAKTVNVPLRFYQYSGETGPPDVLEARLQLSPEQPVFIRQLSSSLLVAYRLFNDLYGKPTLIARISLPRTIYQQGESSIQYFLSFLLAACAVIGLVILLVLEHMVLSRLVWLNQGVTRVRTEKHLTTRVYVPGKDEFSHLAEAMNDMLASLEHSQILLRKLEKAVETTEVGITITDNEGRIVYTNPADARMHGYAVEELIGQSASVFASSESSGIPDKHREVSDFQNWKRERLNRRKDGSTFPVMLISNPITNPQGQPIGRVVVCDDITELKQAEAQLLAAHQELKELNASKDKLFSIIAHDLRSPFTSLLVLSETVLHFLDDYSREELRENMQQIKTTSESVSTLLENLLAWSRLQRGLLTYQPEILNLTHIIHETAELFRMRAQQKQVNLTVMVPPNTLVYADQNMLTTILRNLLSNALKFTSIGQGVAVSAHQETATVAVRVTDTGTGIAPEHLDQLFRLDEQYTQPGTKGEKGSGLGLKLCQELIEAQGGDIEVESTPGRGTTFTFRLAASQ